MEKTTCYQCEAEIEAEVGQVHPLCDECDTSFEDWMTEQLAMFK